MTTVCTDGRTIAADSLGQKDGVVIPNSSEKIQKGNDAIYAFSGTANLKQPMIDWWESGGKPADVPTLGGEEYCEMWVIKDGKLLEVSTTCPHPIELGFPNAMGSGKELALGAMAAGAIPEDAVMIAIEHDVYSGGDIKVIEIPTISLEAAE